MCYGFADVASAVAHGDAVVVLYVVGLFVGLPIKVDDAVEIDTSDIGIQETLDLLLSYIKE